MPFPALPLIRGLGFLGLHRGPMFAMTLKVVIYHSSFLSFFDILSRITTLPNITECFLWKCDNDVTSEI